MKKIFFILSLLACLSIFCPSAVLAADTLGQGMLSDSVGKLGLESDLQNSLANVISTVLSVVGTVFLVLTVAGGIMWMTAAGNDERIGKAKKIIVGAAIGLVISLTAYTITYFVTKTAMGGATNAGNTEVTSEPGCCHTYTGSLGNNYNVMSESACQGQVGFQDWVPGTDDC